MAQFDLSWMPRCFVGSGGGSGYGVDRAPKDHINTSILQDILSAIPFILGLRSLRLCGLGGA